MSLTSTLSLEPLVEALQAVAGPSSSVSVSKPLATSLQRLWRERGDFSKLSRKALLDEQEQEEKKLSVEEDEQLLLQDAGKDNPEPEQSADVIEQTLTPEQLWELKVQLLQGLGLARTDIIAALDLLQLLLNPLNALQPAVPEEALALPSSSFASTTLPMPTPLPVESAHLQGTALSLSTKVRGLSKAAKLLQGASVRLSKTTEETQAEWTDLLRLKRAGEWRLEARPPPKVRPGAPGNVSSIGLQFDRMSRDLCVFCGMEEASVQWRSAGLAKLKATKDSKGKGKQVETFTVPERLEGRRRLAVQLRFPRPNENEDGSGEEELVFVPYASSGAAIDEVPEASGAYKELYETQRELFEEELFAQIIQEARDLPPSPHLRVQAGRNSIQITPVTTDTFTLTLKMIDVDELPDSAVESSEARAWIKMLSVVARLGMIRIYRHRREVLRGRRSSLIPEILPDLIAIIQYQRHATSLHRTLSSIVKSLTDLSPHGALHPHLHFDHVLQYPADIISTFFSSTISRPLRLGGRAFLSFSSDRELEMTFSSPTNVVLQLPTRSISFSSISQVLPLFSQAVRSAVLEQLRAILQDELRDWEVMPVPMVVQRDAKALARRQEAGRITEYISIFPKVALMQDTCHISLEASYASRKTEASVSRTFDAAAGSIDTLVEWLRELRN